MKPDLGTRLPPSRFRRWLKRLLWTGFWLVLILVIFHRPILRFALQRGAPVFAKSGGMKLEWDVGGTVTGSVDIRNVKLTGDAKAPLQKLTAARLRSDYSLWRLLRQGVGRFMDDMVLEDVDLVLDTTKFAAALKEESSPPPEVILPKLRLQNVNARIILADGEVVVRGLNFTLNPGAAGVVDFQELLLPGNWPPMRNVSGQTRAESAKVTFTSLNLLPDLKVQELSVDLGEMEKRRLAFSAALTVPGGTYTDSFTAGGGRKRSLEGHGEVSLAGSLEGLGESPSLHATAVLTNLTPETIQQWVPLSPDVSWRVRLLNLKVNGPVEKPRQLQVEATLEAEDVTAANVILHSVKLDATLENGLLNVFLAADDKQINANATAQLPESWQDIARAEAKAQADVNISNLAAIFTKDAPLTGSLAGKINAAFANGSLLLAQTNLKGSQWIVEGVPVESVEMTATSDGSVVKVEKLKALLDPQNTIDVTGTLGLADAQPVQASWQIDLPNLERFAKWSGRKDTPGPEGGWLKGTGNAAGTLADWIRQDFSKTTAEAKLDASNVAWKTGRMESLTLEATVEAGRATLRNFAAVLNDRNKLTATGGGTLAAPWEFSAKVNGDLSQLADFEGWLKALGVQGPITGKASIVWEGSGRAEDFSITGGGSVNVESFKLAEMTKTASLNLKTSHSGKRADISVLEASMGDLKVSAPGTVTEKLFEIPAVRITAGKLPPVEGRVSVPLDFTQENGPAGPVATNGILDVALHVKDWDLAEAARAAGQKVSLKGRVDAEVTITGTLFNPAADIALNLQKVSSPGIGQKPAPIDATVKLVLRDRKLAANMEVTQKPLQTLRAVASIPLDVQKLVQNPGALKATPLEGSVTLPDSDMNALRAYIEGVASMKGNIGLTANVRGTIGKPVITGEFHALAPTVVFQKKDVPSVRDLKLRVRFEGTRFFIEEAGAMMSGGTATARGTVDWTDAANPKIDATLTAKEALILRDETISMRADGTITCRGSLTQAAVTGRIELVRGRVFKEIEFLPLSLPNQLPPAPPAVIVDRSNAPVLLPPFDKWTFAVDIVTRDAVRLLGNVLNGGLTSNLRLTGTGANPLLEGKATLQNARVRLPFSRMVITRGDIIFTKEKPFEPELDVQGDAFINNYQITLYAYGPALNPKLRFTSSPPLSEGEIATLLATGSTSGDLRSTQGEAANRAAFLLLSQAYRKLFKKPGRSRIDEEPPRLSFSFSLLNNAGGTRSVSAVYEINDRLQAVGSISQAGSFRGLLYYLIRFR